VSYQTLDLLKQSVSIGLSNLGFLSLNRFEEGKDMPTVLCYVPFPIRRRPRGIQNDRLVNV